VCRELQGTARTGNGNYAKLGKRKGKEKMGKRKRKEEWGKGKGKEEWGMRKGKEKEEWGKGKGKEEWGKGKIECGKEGKVRRGKGARCEWEVKTIL
jgi:hypothetical protein